MAINTRREPDGMRLNPFVFPSDTDFRFALLIVATLGASLFIYAALYFSLFSTQYLRATIACLDAAGPLPGSSSTGTETLTQILQQLSPGVAADACMEPQEQAESAWIGGGVLSLLIVAAILYWFAPAWKIYREKLVPLTAEDAPDVIMYLDELWHEAELRRQPIFVWNPLNAATSGVAFGRMNHYYVAIPGGLITTFYTNRPVFRAILLHELAHLRNADTDKTHLTVAIWYAFIIATLVPFLFGSVILYIRGGEWRLLFDLGWRVLALAAFVYLVRNAVLRAREVYADVRASKWDQPTGALRAVLATLPPRHGNRLQKAFSFHPEPKDRVRAIDETFHLFQMSFWDAFGAGVAASIAFPNLESLLLWALPHSLENYASNTAVLLFAPFAAGVVGVGAWRGVFADVAFGYTPRLIGRLGFGLGLGLALGYFLAFYNAIPASLPSSLVEQIVAFFFNVLWMLLLLISLFLFLRWLAQSAAIWLSTASTYRTLRRAIVVNLIVAGIVLALWLGVINELLQLGPLSLMFLFVPEYVIVSARTLFIFVSLWALPLAAWFMPTKVQSERDLNWALLDSSPEQLILPAHIVLQPRVALVTGLIGGIVFCALLLIYRIGLRLVLSEDVRSDNGFILLFFYSQLTLAVLMQAVVAAVVSARTRQMRILQGLFGAFVAGCAITVGLLLLNLLFGGTIDPLFIWTVFTQVVNYGAFVALLVTFIVSRLNGGHQHSSGTGH